MNKSEWVANFENQMCNFFKFDEIIINILIDYLEKDRDLNLSDEEFSQLRLYLLGDQIDIVFYKTFRKQIFQSKLKLDTKNIESKDMRFEVKKKLLGLLYDNYSLIERLDFKPVCNFLIRQLILFKEKNTLYL